MSAGPTVSIRTALVSDVPFCTRLFAAGQQEIEPRAPPWAPGDFAAEVAGEDILVAAREGEVAAFLSMGRADAFVHHLHVARAWRGQGLGRALLAAARAETGRPLELKCLANNGGALAFYRRLGWRPTGATDGIVTPYLRLRGPR